MSVAKLTSLSAVSACWARSDCAVLPTARQASERTQKTRDAPNWFDDGNLAEGRAFVDAEDDEDTESLHGQRFMVGSIIA
jgi:hypothetical protein